MVNRPVQGVAAVEQARLASAIGRVVLAIGTPGFADALLSAMGSQIEHDAAALMVLHPATPPTVLVDRLQPAERSYLYGDYLSGVYTLSPFYRAAQKLKAPRIARVREIAPHGFAHSEYYRRYFALIGVDDMLGVLLPAREGETVFLSFSRSTGRARFTRREAAALESSAEIFSAAVTRHDEIAGPLANRHIAPLAPPPARRPAPSGLTLREAQVVNLMLEGHSARAIAEALRISNETVRVHRRNIYEKLGISSQGELFRWFLANRA
jgi:DNA-binding CsgD family transcriptional regulator